MTTQKPSKKPIRTRKIKNEPVLETNNKPILGVVGNTLWILSEDEPSVLEQTLNIDGFEKPFAIEWVSDRKVFLNDLLMGYNLLENGGFTEEGKKSLKGWEIDSVEGTLAGVDLADEWQLTGGHTAFLLAAENAPRPSFTVAQKIPVIADLEYKFSGYFATQRAEGLITLFCYDENHNVTCEEIITIANQPEQKNGLLIDNYAYIESIFTPNSGAKYLQFKIELGEQIDLSQPNAYLFFTGLFFGVLDEIQNQYFVKNSDIAYQLSQLTLERNYLGKSELPDFDYEKEISVDFSKNLYQVELTLGKQELSTYYLDNLISRIAKECKNKNWIIAIKLLNKWLDKNAIFFEKNEKLIKPTISNKLKNITTKLVNDYARQNNQNQPNVLYMFSHIDDLGNPKKGIFDSPTVDTLFFVRQLSENRPKDPHVWLWLAEVTHALQRWKECSTAYNTLKILDHSFDDINIIRFGEALVELHHDKDAFDLYLSCWTKNFADKFLNKCLDVINQCDNLELSSQTLLKLFKIQKQRKEVSDLMIQIIPRLCVASLANLLEELGDDGCNLVFQSLPNSFENAEKINDWTTPLTLLEALDSANLLIKLSDWLAVECIFISVQIEKLLIISDKIFETQYKQALNRLKALSIWSKIIEFDKNFPLLDVDYLVYGQSTIQKSFASIIFLSDFLAHPGSESVSPHILLSTNWQEQIKSKGFRHLLVDFFRYSNNYFENTPNPNAYFDCDWYRKNYLVDNKEVHPLLHYLTHFQEENVQPNYYFSNAYVSEAQCLLTDDEPLSFYLKQLKKGGVDFCLNGFSPTPFFDRTFYLKHNHDLVHIIETHSLDPLEHFIKHGSKEGRLAYALQEYNEFIRHQRLYLESFNQHTHFGTKGSFQYIKGKKAEVAYFESQKVLANNLIHKPLISILVPVYQVLPRFFEEMIQSVIDQTYDNWQLCLVDDASKRYKKVIHNLLEQYALQDTRIIYRVRKKNGHICNTTNDCIELAKGDYLALLDHDDLLTPDALYEVVVALNNNQNLDILYSDEDKVDEWGVFSSPYYKPDWSPHSLWSRMYTCHLTVYRKSLINAVGGFRVGFEGSQDYDLMLRCSEKTQYIHHISKVLYHWRTHIESTAGQLGGGAKNYCDEAALSAVRDTMLRRGLDANVELVGKNHSTVCVRPKVINQPTVDIIIPSFNGADILEACLTSIFKKTTYQNFKITVIDNNSYESDFFNLIKYWQDQESERFQVIRDERPFNFSTINNSAVQKTDGDYLLFLNNDTEVITEDWLEGMLGYAQLEEVGAVGVKLLYPDNTVQHAGVVTGVCGTAIHVMCGWTKESAGLAGSLKLTTNYSAVTGACLMIKREKFNAVGGFEEYLKVAFNDIDFCLKVRGLGLYNVYLPFVELYHHESKSRGYEDTTEKKERFEKEISFIRQRWGNLLDNDPFYSLWLTRDNQNITYRFH